MENGKCNVHEHIGADGQDERLCNYEQSPCVKRIYLLVFYKMLLYKLTSLALTLISLQRCFSHLAPCFRLMISIKTLMRQYASLKRLSTSTILHGAISYIVVIFTLAAVRTGNLIDILYCSSSY
jgi:hypothetical protein